MQSDAGADAADILLCENFALCHVLRDLQSRPGQEHLPGGRTVDVHRAGGDGLGGDPLAAPETPLAPGVWQRIRRRAWRIVTSRYATAAAAAAFALIIWGTGLFQNLGTPREVKPAPPAEPKAYSTVTSRMNEFVSETGRQINAAITDFFARFQKGAQQ